MWILKAFCFSWLLLGLGTAQAETESKPISVLVHQSVKVDNLSSAQLRMIFAGRTQFWPDGSRIRVFVLPADGAIHQQFCRDLLNIYPYQLKRIWQQVVYSGQGEAPASVDSTAAMLNSLSQTPGSIGYLQQPFKAPDNINIITVGAQP